MNSKTRTKTTRTGVMGMTTVKEEIREGVDRETVEAVREVGSTYKHGWNTDIEME